jgi:hypothetical protein
LLKGLITEPTLPIEAKYQNVIQVTNMLHVMMASNQDWVVPASHDERRYLVLDVADHRIGDREYFAALTKQMEDGGLAAMIHELLQRDISKFEVRDFPNTPALADQKKHSLDSLHKWWLAVLERGYLYKSRHGVPWFTDWHAFYSTELLARSYQQWCDETRPYDRKTRFDLGRMMTDIYIPHRPGAGNPQPIHEIESVDVDPILKHDNWLDHHAIVRKERPTGHIVGDLEESQARFTQMCDVVGDWA